MNQGSHCLEDTLLLPFAALQPEVLIGIQKLQKYKENGKTVLQMVSINQIEVHHSCSKHLFLKPVFRHIAQIILLFFQLKQLLILCHREIVPGVVVLQAQQDQAGIVLQ